MQWSPGNQSAESDPGLVGKFVPEVKRGDVMTFNSWYNNSDAEFVKRVYEAAGPAN